MKKRQAVIFVLLAVVMAAFIAPCLSVAAAEDQDGHLPRLIDEEKLLTASQARELTAKLDEVSERNRFDTVILITHSLNRKDPRLYAADFYEQNGFGYGSELDGIILLLAMEYRDFAFVTTGFGLYAFTDAGQVYLEKQFLPHLSNGDYFEAFMVFADGVEDFVQKAEAGQRYDKGNIPLMPEERASYRLWFGLIGLALAFIIPAIIVGGWASQLKSVQKSDYAAAYIREGSMVVNLQRDIFLHKQVSKTPRANSSSGGSGGSFSSSSGRSFSGRSGKF